MRCAYCASSSLSSTGAGTNDATEAAVEVEALAPRTDGDTGVEADASANTALADVDEVEVGDEEEAAERLRRCDCCKATNSAWRASCRDANRARGDCSSDSLAEISVEAKAEAELEAEAEAVAVAEVADGGEVRDTAAVVTLPSVLNRSSASSVDACWTSSGIGTGIGIGRALRRGEAKDSVTRACVASKRRCCGDTTDDNGGCAALS